MRESRAQRLSFPFGPQNSSLRLRALSRISEAMEQLDATERNDVDSASSSRGRGGMSSGKWFKLIYFTSATSFSKT